MQNRAFRSCAVQTLKDIGRLAEKQAGEASAEELWSHRNNVRVQLQALLSLRRGGHYFGNRPDAQLNDLYRACEDALKRLPNSNDAYFYNDVLHDLWTDLQLCQVMYPEVTLDNGSRFESFAT